MSKKKKTEKEQVSEEEKNIETVKKLIDELMKAKSDGNKLEYAQLGISLYSIFVACYYQGFSGDEQTDEEIMQIIAEFTNANNIEFHNVTGDIINALKNNHLESADNFIETKSKFLKYLGLMKDKVMTRLIEEPDKIEYDAGQLQTHWAIDQSRDDMPEVPVYLSLTYQGNGKKPKNISSLDWVVMGAIGSAGFNITTNRPEYPLYITPEEIFRIMNGITDTRKKIHESQLKGIRESMNKMRTSMLYMDITDEIEKHNLSINDERIIEGTIEDNVIHASKMEFKTKSHKKVTGYKVLAEPFLYTYNRSKGHLIFMPRVLADVSDETGLDGYTVEIRTYLYQRIEMLYTKTLHNSKILFSALYEATGIPAPEMRVKRTEETPEKNYQAGIRKQRKRDRDKVTGILTSWKKKEYISDFSITNGKKGDAVTIILNPNISAEREKDKTKALDPALLKMPAKA